MIAIHLSKIIVFCGDHDFSTSASVKCFNSNLVSEEGLGGGVGGGDVGKFLGNFREIP